MTVLEMSASHDSHLQSRILKQYSRSSNSGPGLLYDVLHLVLDSKEGALNVSGATPLTCFRIKSRLTNPSIQMPLTHTIISKTPYWNFWMTVNSMLETYGSQTKCIFTSMDLSTSRLCEFGEEKILILPSSLHSPKIMVWTVVFSKGIIGSFFRKQPINPIRYIEILEEFIGIHTALEDSSNVSWFMQDGVRPL